MPKMKRWMRSWIKCLHNSSYECIIDVEGAKRALPKTYKEFHIAQWSALVDIVTVMDKNWMIWKLTSGTEIGI